MAEVTINAEVRAESGKGPNRRLRASGRVPAVLYGNGNEPTGISLDPRDVIKAFEGPCGKNTVITLNVAGLDGPRKTIVRQYQVHPWKRTLEHLDFWEITDKTVLTLKVPFNRLGKSPMEQLGYKARQTRADVVIQCLPDAIPASIDYDMGSLDEQTPAVKMSEVPMPDGVAPSFKMDYTILQMKIPRAQPLEEEVEEEASEEGGEESAETEEASAETSE